MHNKDTILIFQEPELYFFPYYKDIVFKPFGISEKSFFYIIYKILYILRIPLCSIFWGDWKKHLKTAKKVIIFDYGYQRGMENYIRKINPDCQVYLFLWNMIDAVHKNHTIYSDKSAIYSTDPGDCQKYNLHYNHIFYPMEYCIPYLPETANRLFFIGNDKNRGLQIVSLYHIFQKSGLDCDIRLLTNNKDSAYLEQVADIVSTSALSYKQYLEEIKHCGVLLDIVQNGQKALTMRVMEAIFLSKKLITNNQDIINYDFYHPNNILILPQTWDDSMISLIQDFMNKPFLPYSDETINKYDFNHWTNSFTS